MINPIVLSICIPTYNRSQKLKRCLESVTDQINKYSLESKVELCISDNCYSDNTQEVIETIEIENPNLLIKTYRQKSNLGFAKNFYQVWRIAGGEYLFMSGDDDVFRDGSIQMMLDQLDKKQSRIIIFSSSRGDGRFFKQDNLNDTYLIQDGLQANQDLGIFHLSFIGNVLIEKDLFWAHFKTDYLDSAYPHTSVWLSALNHIPEFAVFTKYAILSVDDSSRIWLQSQPLYTSVDMAMIQTTVNLVYSSNKCEVYKNYHKLIRCLPKAIYRERIGAISTKPNCYSSLSYRNISNAYRLSMTHQILAVLIVFFTRRCPLWILQLLKLN
jgi:glycosyltransferase involved in cell wall biosynthesis